MIMPKIIRNAIRCKKCGDIIESQTVHDFKFCSCGACAVDGGHDYLRRCGNLEDWEELSKAERVEDNSVLSISRTISKCPLQKLAGINAWASRLPCSQICMTASKS